MIDLTARLTTIRARRAALQSRIALKSGRRQAVSFEQAKLVRETLAQLKTEMKLEKKRTA